MTEPARTTPGVVTIASVAAPVNTWVPATEFSDRRERHAIDVQTGCIPPHLECGRASRQPNSTAAGHERKCHQWSAAVPAEAAPKRTGLSMHRRQTSEGDGKGLRRAIQRADAGPISHGDR